MKIIGETLVNRDFFFVYLHHETHAVESAPKTGPKEKD